MKLSSTKTNLFLTIIFFLVTAFILFFLPLTPTATAFKITSVIGFMFWIIHLLSEALERK